MNNHNQIFKRSLVIAFLLTVNVVSAFSIEISGTVKDSIANNPIEGVVVRVMDGKKPLAFTTTNASGAYKMTFENPPATFVIFFQHVSFKGQTLSATNRTRQINTRLATKVTMLREAVVKTPDIFVKKDTVSYDVASFTSASDRTIEDVLKKLPGVEVSNSGAIKYQGKDISQFSIEGLDALGGKYTLATRNIEAKDVNRVEMTENFQKEKMLQGKEHSDKVAMNLKLKESAKMKLIGTQEAGLGVRDKDILYHGGLTGMIFSKQYQFIGTLKANNWGQSLAEEIYGHYGESYIHNLAGWVLGEDLGARPSLPHNLYQQKNELMSSLNTIVKLSEEKTVRVNADYLKDKSQYRYKTVSNYYLNNSNITITELQAPEYEKDKFSASLNVTLNSPKKFIENATYFETSSLDNKFDLLTGSSNIQQSVKSSLTGIRNDLNYRKKIGKKSHLFISRIGYSKLPDKRLKITGVEGQTGEFYQSVEGASFFSNNGTSLDYNLSSQSKASIWLNALAEYNWIDTHLQKNDSINLNKNDGYYFDISVSPSYSLATSDKRFDFKIDFPLHEYNIGFKNRNQENADFYMNSLLLSPSFNGLYRFSPLAKIEFSGGLDNSIGNMTDFLINPIQASYKVSSSKSGILQKNKSAKVRLSFIYQRPTNLLFTNCTLSYNQGKRNILNGRNVTVDTTGLGISTSNVKDDNITQNISLSGNLEKGIKPLHSTFYLNSNYSYSTSMQLSQGVKMDVNYSSFSLSPRVRSVLGQKFTINYSMSYSKNTIKNPGQTTINHQQTHDINLNYILTNYIYLYSNFKINHTEILPDQYKDMYLLDAGLTYRHKKFEAELKLNNLLNLREYSYTVLRDLDSFTYTYYLNPREAVVIFRFSL